MADSIKMFENSLRDYLINVQSDSYNSAVRIEHRYNNLKVFMDHQKNHIPHFFVSVNISEGCYSFDPLEKIDGGLASDDRYVLMWASRPNINGELRKHWAYLTQQSNLLKSPMPDEEDEEENSIKNDLKKPIPEEDEFMPQRNDNIKTPRRINIDASEYVTGTGIKKAKYNKLNEKKDDPNSQS